MNKHEQLAVKALEQLRGDDLYRARAAFKNCTPEQMAQEYGESGQTRAEILASYEEFDAEVSAAVEWVQGLDSEKYYLICYQQKWNGREHWITANVAVNRDPGVWLAEKSEVHFEEAQTVLLSAVPVSRAGYDALCRG